MTACEHYARAVAQSPRREDLEVTVGVEYTLNDDVDEMTIEVKNLASQALWAHGGNHVAVAEHAKLAIQKRWPGRAFFIETDEFGRGVQVYQPFGMPRERCAGCGGKLCES